MPRLKKQKPALYTIGHSTRTIDEFIKVLAAQGIQEVADIRSIPKSRHNPQFNETKLQRSLQKHRIAYRHIKELGGLRHAKKDSLNLGWKNLSFRGFADYMTTEEFAKGLTTLLHIARKKRTAIMCAEALPWRCHRSLVADAAIKQGWMVYDIFTATKAHRHTLTPFLRMRRGIMRYPLLEK